MANICPDFLKEGSKIIIVSPSGGVDKDFVFSARDFLVSCGFEVLISSSCLNKYFQYAGTDAERLEDLQQALDDDSVDAILCSRGGYGLIRIINNLNFDRFLSNPKWIAGFSDITNLHMAVNKLGVMSIHAQMTKAIYEDPLSVPVKDLIRTFKGDIPGYSINPHLLNKYGNTEAELIGGNLSIIYSLQGTEYEIDTNGKILFIEDLNEYLYHLDRIMNNLKLSGKLQNLKGLIVGAFTDMKDNPKPFGKNTCEIINEYVSEYFYPVCFDFPAGHIKENFPLVMGMKYNLTVTPEKALLYNCL